MNLFDEADKTENSLTINEKYAVRFEQTERQKELRDGRVLLNANDDDDEDSEESESEDENAELLSMSLNVQVLNTINSIRKKDPRIYDKEAKWFPESEESDVEDGEDGATGRKAYKDVLREQLLKHGADIDDSEELSGIPSRKPPNKIGDLIYDEEQKKMRADFLKSLEGDGNTADNEILISKPKSNADAAREAQELNKALDEMKRLAKDEGEATRDAFLSEYISNRKWVDTTAIHRRGSSDDEDDDGEDLEADEEELDKVDFFESKYNHRFEELQDDEAGIIGSLTQVVGHARNVEGSVRRVDDKRKLQREQRAERKAKERRQKEAELRRLKNLKKQEVL